MKGSYTERSESVIPDSELVCRFCGKNDRQHDMSIRKTARTKAGKVIRVASHRSCNVEYKGRLKRQRETAKGGAGNVDVELDVDFTSQTQTPVKRNSLFSRLIES